MKAASAWCDVTPEGSIDLLGQMRVRKAERTRDPLTVNAAVFEDAGRRVALVSADVCLVPDELVVTLRDMVKAQGIIKPDDFVITATHTHVSACTTNGIAGEIDPKWLERFKAAVLESIAKAAEKLEDVTLWSGNGWCDLMGWNRRGMHRDGTCDMYHGSWREGFKGIEGPRDGHVGLIWATNAKGDITLVISSFSTHPNCVEGESFYSADLPGEVRKVLRGALGENVGVIYLTGAAGDTAPSIMENNKDNKQPWRGEAGVVRSGRYLGGEMLKTIAVTINPMESQALGAAHENLQIPMRPWDAWFDPDKLGDGGMKDFCLESRNDWDRLMKEANPVHVPVHVVRLGDAAICFNPSELFCEFGLAIKQNSPAKTTLIGELSNGWCGYIPTPAAIMHGGYSARSSSHTRCVPDAGWRIVESTQTMLGKLFDK